MKAYLFIYLFIYFHQHWNFFLTRIEGLSRMPFTEQIVKPIEAMWAAILGNINKSWFDSIILL